LVLLLAIGIGIYFAVAQRDDILSWVTGTAGTVRGAYESGVDRIPTSLPTADLPTSEQLTDAVELRRVSIPTWPVSVWTDETTILKTEREIQRRINIERSELSFIPQLRWDEDLASVARAHSEDMARRGYFDHDTPEGLDPTDRLHRAGFSCRKPGRYGIAENIAIESSLDSVGEAAEEAVVGWVGSPGHRRILMNGEYDRTGVGAALGTYQGRKALYLTQVFC